MSNQAPTAGELSVFVQQQQALGFQVPVRELKRRWTEQVVPNRWHLQGTAGAIAYLAKYGHNLKLPKLTGLALYAEQEHCQKFATRLWRHAYVLAHQGLPPAAKVIAPTFSDFPPELRPGQLKLHRGILKIRNATANIDDPSLWGFELAEGVTMIGFGAGGLLAYQTEAGQVGTWHPNLDEAFMFLERIVGPFILEGTAAFRDGKGNLHTQERVAKQATPGVPPVLSFVVLRAWYVNRNSLLEGPESSRQAAAADLTAYLAALATEPKPFEAWQVQIARTIEEKRALAAKHEIIGWCWHNSES